MSFLKLRGRLARTLVRRRHHLGVDQQWMNHAELLFRGPAERQSVRDAQ